MKFKLSPQLLLLIISLMVTFIFVQLNIFDFFEKDIVESKVDDPHFGIISDQYAESKMYDHLHNDSPIPKKSIKRSNKRAKDFYKNRAYAGAPPRIPHKVSEVIKTGGFEDCLQCHKNGSYSPEFKAYAPIAPHPEYTSCRQCHVEQKTKRVFKGTNWKNDFKVVKGRRHLPGSPPVIPHSLQLRENCLSCHFGEGAMEEIKVSHPEKANCRQCHVQTTTTESFQRDRK